MLQAQAAFSGFSVSDLKAAKTFYTEKLGLKIVDETMGLTFALPGGGKVFAYEKPNHQPASYTMLNFVVSDIDAAVDQLKAQGITCEQYEGMQQDENGIARGTTSGQGPDIAWFRDPSGNILSVLQDAA